MIPLVLALAIAAPAAAADAARPGASAPKPHAAQAHAAPGRSGDGLVELNVRVPFAGHATLYLPPKPLSRAILFLSGDGGWNLGVVEMARRAARENHAAVAGVSLPAYLKAANSEKVPCWCPACDLEEIGKSIEKQAGFEEPSPPILLGYSSGATLVYAALAGGPPETFAGGMSLGFCPDLEGVPSICRHAGFRPVHDAAKRRLDFSPAGLERPWVVLQGNADKVCGAEATDRFVREVKGATLERLDGVGHGYGNETRWGPAFDAGLRSIVAASSSAAAGAEKKAPSSTGADELKAALEKLDLPLTLHLSDHPRAYLLFISGDGGWSSLDRNLASRLARDHVDTVGISALQYFWKEKPAERTAADLKRILDLLRPQEKPILFGGYSFGAEVAPFLVNRPEYGAAAADPAFAGLVLVAPGPFATWEVSPLDWFRQKEKESPDKVRPQIESIVSLPTLCVYGADDRESACSGLKPAESRLVRALGGGHHFGGDYDVIADEVAQFVAKTLPAGVLSSGSSHTPETGHP